MKRGNWTDQPCWYCSIMDAGRTGLVLGPFPTEASCRVWAYQNPENGGNWEKHQTMRTVAEKCDCRQWFYSWGMVKMENGHHEGSLNRLIEGWDTGLWSKAA